METPSSTTRRVTRSQTGSIKNTSRKMEESEKIVSKSKQRTTKSKQERSVLIDITNDSPIVGVAASGSLETPISALAKQRSSRCKRTPGSGEALLRGQVKNLLQKVEEEAEISKFSLPSGGDRPLINNLKAFLNSPAGLLAPTPANTPLILNFSALDEVESFGSVSPAPIEDQLTISQVVSGIFNEKKQVESGSSESEKDLITRSLFLDFSEKSETSSDCSSVVTYQGAESQEKAVTPLEDDDASVWSIQVNASTRDEDEDEDEVIEDDDEGEIYDNEDEYYDGEEEEEDESLLLDDLCEGISKINVNEEKGKHKRFVYNSDDELVDERDVLHLKGLPTPKGKYLRFQDEE